MAPTDRTVPLLSPPFCQPLPTDSAAAVSLNPAAGVTTFVLLFLALIFLFFFFSLVRRSLSDVTPAPRRLPTHIRYLGAGFFIPFSATSGLDPSAIRALPVMSYTGKAARSGCVVCLCEFEEKESLKVIPACRHVFHPGCIDAWLVSRGSCPICRCSEMFGERWRGGDVRVSVFGGDGDDGGGVGQMERREGGRGVDGDGRGREVSGIATEYKLVQQGLGDGEARANLQSLREVCSNDCIQTNAFS